MTDGEKLDLLINKVTDIESRMASLEVTIENELRKVKEQLLNIA